MTDVKSNELKINDKVVFSSLEYSYLKNLKGKIIEFRNDMFFDDILVEFDKYNILFHEGKGQGKGYGYYWYCVSEELQKVDDCLKIKIRKLKKLIKKD